MTSYLLTIATGHHGTCRKMCARDERTATASGADVLSSGKKKTQKIGRGGAGERGNGWHPTVVGCPFFVSLNLVVLSPV